MALNPFVYKVNVPLEGKKISSRRTKTSFVCLLPRLLVWVVGVETFRGKTLRIYILICSVKFRDMQDF